MLYVGERHLATRQVGVKLEFACPGCGFNSTAYAIGRGRGEGRNPYFLAMDAGQRARDEAYFDAHRSAREAITLVRCPRCGDRNSRAWRWFWTKAVLALLGTAALPLGMGLLFGAAGIEAVWWMMLGLTPILLVVVYLWSIRWRFKTAEARVLFDPPRLKHRRRHDPTAGASFPDPNASA